VERKEIKLSLFVVNMSANTENPNNSTPKMECNKVIEYKLTDEKKLLSYMPKMTNWNLKLKIKKIYNRTSQK
jgi:hypothetical protein